MPSLFTRSKQTQPRPAVDSTPRVTTLNEFGQYADQPRRQQTNLLPPPSTSQRPRTAPAGERNTNVERELPDLPLPYFLDARYPDDNQSESEHVQQYGYISEGQEVVLGLQTVRNLVELVGKQLDQKGLNTPLLFSNRALDLSSHRVRALIRAFLRTVGRAHPDPDAENRWRDEVRFSGPHELAAVLRWALARVVRIQDGVELRGMCDISMYDEWRNEELARRYPPDSFLSFPARLPSQVQPILAALFPMLSRFAAHASYSGLTPTSLSSLFGPLLFGLGLPSQPFTATYHAYLVTSHATEHLLLAYIRLQEYQSSAKPGAALPTRLRDWVRGYPAMLPASRSALEQPRAGDKLVRVLSVRRNVRLYSRDLVRTASTWALDATDRDAIKEWSRVVGPGRATEAKFSEAYRKKLDLPLSAMPASQYSRASPRDSEERPAALGTIVLPDADKFKSLTDLRWGMFETSGFDPPDLKKLEFDLNESARKYRPSKRDTLAWSDFESSGFSRDDISLDFSPAASSSIQTWPDQQAELHRKLRKTHKALPSFGWSIEPVPGRDKLVEEGFIDCWADLLLGSGWMDREEQTYRDCNWVLVDYKAAPGASSPSSRPQSALTPAGADNRSSNQWYVFEEFVPSEYRDSLSNPKKKRGGLFSTKTKRPQPLTVNGRPYSGGGPRSPGREVQFERMISSERGVNTTRISLSPPPIPDKSHISGPLHLPREEQRSRKSPIIPIHAASQSGKLGRLKSFGRSSPHQTPSEETAVEYEFASASGGSGSDSPRPDNARDGKRKRPAKMHETWVDIRLPDREGRDRGERSTDHRREAVQRTSPPRRQPEPDPDDEGTIEPVEFTHQPPLESPPAGRSSGGEDSEYEGGTSLQDLGIGKQFPMPPNFHPGAHLHVPFPRAERQSPPSEEEVDDERADFEPIEESAEGADEQRVIPPETEEEEEEDVDEATTDASGPDQSTPFDPASPGGIPPMHWQALRSEQGAAAKHGSGVSSLLDLYQDRERAILHDVDRASRIPVRVQRAASPPNLASTSVLDAFPVSAATSVTAAEPALPADSEIPTLPVPTPRYVHGAPLHNLPEAEEEEEE